MDAVNNSNEKINTHIENYKLLKGKYSRFSKGISQLLKQLLDSASVKFQQVTYREKDIETLKGATGSQQQLNNQNKEITNVLNTAKRSFQDFGSKNSDFNAAIQYLSNHRKEELKELGYDDVTADQVMSQEVLQISDHCNKNNTNVAKVFYNIAKQRGFKSPEAEASNSDRLNSGQSRSTSLSQGNNKKTQQNVPGLEDLINASDDKFDEMWNKFRAEAR